jgi:hypothetical protein
MPRMGVGNELGFVEHDEPEPFQHVRRRDTEREEHLEGEERDVEPARQEEAGFVGKVPRATDHAEADLPIHSGEILVLLVDERAVRQEEDRLAAADGGADGAQLADERLSGARRRHPQQRRAVQDTMAVDGFPLHIIKAAGIPRLP